jgi:hypothetical protein
MNCRPGIVGLVVACAGCAVLACKVPDAFVPSGAALEALRGGQNPICAGSVVNLAASCNGRIRQLPGGGSIYCDGNNLDQDCTSASTNNHNVCNRGAATCSGDQWYSFDGNTYVDVGSCVDCTYTTAALRAGTCDQGPIGG